ncbi:MAG TPA: 50S ribosomal protein L10 [Candidatus Saccharimonadales bacterium]|nr:50S ribosomal protein L10 [Candidatus Saccharimonadales bacterium]
MALTKAKKEEIVSEVSELLNSSKLTVIANYQGSGVKQLQELRRDARANGTKVKVIKNRLVIKALKSSDKYKSIDTDKLTAQLIYAFNSEDEVAPAQALARFAKAHKTLEFVGALSEDGSFMEADDVKQLASLPSKEQLRGQLLSVLSGPQRGFVSVLSGNIRGVLNVLNARSESIS